MGGLNGGDYLITGDEGVDKEHEEISDLFAKLLGAGGLAMNVAEFNRAIYVLQFKIRHHFDHEEKVFGVASYPQREAHAAAHAEIRQKLKNWLDSLADIKDVAALQKSASAIFDVWLDHLGKWDRPMAQVVRAGAQAPLSKPQQEAPVTVASAVAKPPTPAPSAPAKAGGWLILALEDSQFIQKILPLLLKPLKGAELHICPGTPELVEKTAALEKQGRRPDLFLLDLNCPGYSQAADSGKYGGLQAVHILRRDSRHAALQPMWESLLGDYRQTPVLMFTTEKSPELLAIASGGGVSALGANQVLDKTAYLTIQNQEKLHHLLAGILNGADALIKANPASG